MTSAFEAQSSIPSAAEAAPFLELAALLWRLSAASHAAFSFHLASPSRRQDRLHLTVPTPPHRARFLR